MNSDDVKNVLDIAKSTSEVAKNFYGIVESILQPKGLDLAILDGHRGIIESYVSREDIDNEVKMAFLSNYKRMVKEYKNCKRIIELANPQIAEDAKHQNIEEDWFAFFFDKVRLISDEVVQRLWGKILANEVNTPGTFQRSLLHTLSIMSSPQAELFCNIARFCLYEHKGDSVHPILFVSTNVESYLRSRIDSARLLDLENLGLIQCDFKNEYIFHKKKVFRYGNRLIEVRGDPVNDDKILAGNVRFTYNGRALFEVVSNEFKQYRRDILDFAIARFLRRNCVVIVDGRIVQ